MTFPVSGVDVFPLVPPLVAFLISFATSMGGVSGAFLLLPFQVSVLGFDSPAVSPTNLIYNIVAIPSGVYRFIREGRMAWPLAWVIIAGTLPGVFIGVALRILYLPDPAAFKLFVGCVLLYIGFQLLYRSAGRRGSAVRKPQETAAQVPHEAGTGQKPDVDPRASGKTPGAAVKTVYFSLWKCEYAFRGERYGFNPAALFAVTLLVGIIGGTYGIGGGSIIAPFCIAVLGLPVYTVAGATLLGTFVTSIAGVGYYYAAAVYYEAPGMTVTPDWLLGLFFGIGGFAGMYCGARVQKFVPEMWIKRVLGVLILSLSFRYVTQFFF